MNRQKKVGIIGSSFIAGEFIEAVRKSNYLEVSALYSRTEEAGLKFILEHKIEKLYTDYDKLLEDKRIDIVYIATPNSLHYDQAKKAISAKKHVIVEKPITLKRKELEDLYTQAKDNDVIIMEAIVNIHYNTFKTVKKWLKEIGDINYVQFGLQKQTRHFESYKKGNFINVLSSKMGGGALRDLGPYPLYPLVYYFGRPSKVEYYSVRNTDMIDETCSLACSYKNFTAFVNTSKTVADPRPNIISGTEGYILIDNINLFKSVRLYDIDGELKDEVFSKYKNRMVDQVNYFIDLLKNTSFVDEKFKANSLEVCELIEGNYNKKQTHNV